MAEAFGIACHELVSLDFRCGSPSDLPSLAQNVGIWGISGPQLWAVGLPSLASTDMNSTKFSLETVQIGLGMLPISSHSWKERIRVRFGLFSDCKTT